MKLFFFLFCQTGVVLENRESTFEGMFSEIQCLHLAMLWILLAKLPNSLFIRLSPVNTQQVLL